MDRKRSANFTLREKEILISLVEKYFKIIENKKTNAVYNKQKAECWEKLAWEFIATQTTGVRTGAQLKATYEKMKQLAKQHKSEEKVETLKTGGGTFVSKLTDLEERILMLLKTNFFSIQNAFDSDGSVAVKNLAKSGKAEVENYSEVEVHENPNPIITSKKQNIGRFQNSENIILIYEPEDDEKSDTTTNTNLMQTSLPHMEHDMRRMPDRSMACFDNTVPAKPYRSLECQNNKVNEDIESCQKSIVMNPKFPSESIENPEVATPQGDRGKKRKFKPNLKEKDIGRQSLLNQKMELLGKKSSILDIIKEVETENLKSKKLDNEIKEIVKEREKLELKIRYNTMVTK